MAVLIFDYDGTIHDSMYIYAPSVRACHRKLAAEGILDRREVTDAEIRSYLGLTAQEMWQAFAPSLSPQQHLEGSRFIYREMRRLILDGQARLYEGAEEVLRGLKEKGHHLVFLSNCSEGYRDLHARYFGLDRYFAELYCTEQFGWMEKWQIVRQLLPGWEGASFVIAIGDRYKDMEMKRAALESQDDPRLQSLCIRTVFCGYGFGEPEEGKGADARAESVCALPACIRQLTGPDPADVKRQRP